MKPAHPRRLLPLGIVTAFLLSACGAYGPRPAEGLGGEQSPDAAWQVQFNDDLEGELKVENLKPERTETGALRVTIKLWNQIDEELELLVQVEFRDGEGRPYADESNRDRIAVPRGSMKVWSKESLQARAQQYTIRIWRYKP